MKRFNMYADEVLESPNGAWVMAEDALALQAENDRLFEENARLASAATEMRVTADMYGHRLTTAMSSLRRLQTIYDGWITAGRPK